MKKVLIIGPSTTKAHGGMSEVTRAMLESDILSKKYDLEEYESYVDGSKVKRFLFGAVQYMKSGEAIDKSDLVHIHMTKDGSAKRKLKYAKKAMKAGKPVIIHLHNTDKLWKNVVERNGAFKEDIEYVFSHAESVWCLSKAFAEKIRNEFDLDNVIDIPNGIDRSEWEYNNGGEGALFISRILNDKGVFELIDAAKILQDRGEKIKITVAGDGADKEKMLEKIKEYGLNNVEYAGWVSGDRKKELLKNSRYMVLPSYTEAFPVSILEAMSSGCMVIATDTGAVSEIISNGIIEMKSAEAIADEITKWEHEDEERRKIVEKNLESVKQRYDLDIVHARYVEEYEKALAKK